MIVCEVCKKEKTDWENDEFLFTFVFHVESDNEEHYICPKCAYERIIQLAKNGGDTK